MFNLQKQRNLKYTGPFYSVDDPEYVCPWCIYDGSAATAYHGEFNDYASIEGVSPDPAEAPPAISTEYITEITQKTPGYHSWQQGVWLIHCDEPCAFLGYADSEKIKPFLEELGEDIKNCGIDPEYVKNHLTKDSDVAGYLFQCVRCGKHRLHADCN